MQEKSQPPSKAEERLSTAIKERGASFIDGALLIMQNNGGFENSKEDIIAKIKALKSSWQNNNSLQLIDFYNLQLILVAYVFHNGAISDIYNDPYFKQHIWELNQAEVLNTWKTLIPQDKLQPSSAAEGIAEESIALDKNDVSAIKAWVTAHAALFPTWKKKYLEDFLTNNPTLTHGAVSTIRDILGLNAFFHICKINKKEFCNIRSGIVVPFDIKDDTLAQAATQNNIQWLLKVYNAKFNTTKSPPKIFFIQTLVTPFFPAVLDQETRMQQILHKAVKDLQLTNATGSEIQVLVSNRPLNVFRDVSDLWASIVHTEAYNDTQQTVNILREQLLKHYQEKNINTDEILEALKTGSIPKNLDTLLDQFYENYLKTSNPQDAAAERMMLEAFFKLQAAANKASLNIPMRLLNAVTTLPIVFIKDCLNALSVAIRNRMLIDSKNDNLHLSAYEQIVVMGLNGIATGSCKSGKDRKGVAETALDTHITCAMNNNGKLADPSSDNFKEKFYAIFNNGLNKKVANSNALGCSALKSLPVTLGSDLTAYFRTEDFDFATEKKIASLNKTQVKKLAKQRDAISMGELHKWRHPFLEDNTATTSTAVPSTKNLDPGATTSTPLFDNTTQEKNLVKQNPSPTTHPADSNLRTGGGPQL